jgi:hypothetical protein
MKTFAGRLEGKGRIEMPSLHESFEL